MLNPQTYRNALLFAAKHHHSFGELLPGSEIPYFAHPVNVAMEVWSAHCQSPDFDLDYALEVALLHDVVEHTAVPIEKVETQFGNRVAKGVLALTKNFELEESNQLMDSLARVKKCPIEVQLVKLADRIDKLSTPNPERVGEKMKAYLESSRMILSELKGANTILEERLEGIIAEKFGMT